MKKLYLLLLFVSIGFAKAFADSQVTFKDDKGVTWGFDFYSGYWDGSKYVEFETGLQLTSVVDYGDEVIIPEKVTYEENEYTVLAIGNYVFQDNITLTSVTLPSTIKRIDYYAFYGCRSLKEVKNTMNCESFGGGAFYECKALEEIDLSSCKTLEWGVFNNCQALKTVKSLSKIESIGSSAFSECKSLKEIDLPSGVVIDNSAFSGCKNLTKIGSLDKASIGEWAFSSCESLNSVDLSTAKKIGNWAFHYCTSLESVGDLSLLGGLGDGVFYNCTSLSEIDLSSCKTMGYSTFQGCTSLSKVVLGVCETIGYDAFNNCPIKTIDLSKVKTIGERAFSNCRNLEDIGSIDNLKIIERESFYDCVSLKKVDLSKISTIGERAFSGCTVLESIGNIANVTVLNNEVFYNCNALKSIDLSKVTSIGDRALYNCGSITELDLSACESIGEEAFRNCNGVKKVSGFDRFTEVPNNMFYECSALETIDLSKCKKIGDYAFYGCKALKNVDLSVCETLGSCAFINCASLETVNMPLVKTLPVGGYDGWYDEYGNYQWGARGAFDGCKGLTEVRLSACEAIGSGMFRNCASLEKVYLDSCKTVDSEAFYGCKSLKVLYVPVCDSIGSRVFMGCSSLETIDMPLLTFIPEGSSDSWYDENGEYHWGYRGTFWGCTALKEVKLPACKTLGSAAFKDCATIETVDLSSCKSIDSEAFYGCKLLKEISIPACDSIGSSAFKDCAALEKIDLTKCKTVCDDAFYGCKSLATLELPACVTLGTRTFMDCSSLGTVNMPLLISIPDGNYESWTDENGNWRDGYRGVFTGCKSLKEVKIPACTSLGSSAFKDCALLETVDVSNCKYVGTEAFYGCKAIKGLNLAACDSLGSRTFLGCASLATINMPLVKAIPEGYSDSWYDEKGEYHWGNRGTFWGCNSLKEVSIPACETLGNSVFEDCIFLEKVDLTNCKTIGDNAFAGCTALKNVDLSACETLGSAAFRDCSSLEILDLPLIKSIPDGNQWREWTDENGNWHSGYFGTFNGCTSLKEVKLSSCETLGSSAFKSCTSLEKIDLTGCKTIGSDAFNGCVLLKDVIITSCDSLGSSAFRNCTSLEKIDLTNCKTIAAEAFWGCKVLKSIDLSKCETLGSSVFMDCASLETMDLPLVTAIPDGYSDSWYDEETGNWQWGYKGAFSGCKALKEIKIPSCKIIGSGAFTNCSNLASIGTLAGCDSIGASAFYGCNNLGNFIIESTTLHYIGERAFDYVGQITLMSTTPATIATDAFGENILILVPSEALSTYQAAESWYDIRNRVFAIGDKFDYDINVTANDKSSGIFDVLGENDLRKIVTLKLTGTINSYDFMILRDKTPNLHHLDLSETTVKACPTYEYYTGFTSRNDTLTSKCFSGLDKLLTLKLPKTIKFIEYDAVSNCRNLQSVEFYEGIEYINSYAFQSCYSLKEVILPKGLQSIGYSAFSNCNSLQKVVLSEGLKYIEGWAFANCTSLKEVTFPTTLKTIGDYAFAWCYALPTIELPSRLVTIQWGAFQDCSSLKELNIPSSVKLIYDNAFSGCNQLNKVYTYTILPTNINQNTFSNYENATLYIPKFSDSYNNYWWATAWSQFGTRLPFDKPYDYFYLSTDYTLDEDRIDGTPNADLNPGGALMVSGSDSQNINELTIMSDENGMGGTVIADGNITANALKFEIDVTPGRWYFFSFPFDIKMSNIECPGEYIFRYYDGQTRAELGYGGWKNMSSSSDVLKRGAGYIFQCNIGGQLVLNVDDPTFTADDFDQSLIAYSASNTQDAGWNFIGNPFTSYYGINDTKYTSPITIWNHSTNTYEALRPGDDDYHLYPFQAFFVQKPETTDQIEFAADNRTTYYQAEKKDQEAKSRRMTRGVSDGRELVELTIADSVVNDKTRIVFNENAKVSYETACDAAKFMSLADIPQIYSMDGEGNKYAINERPAGEVKIAYLAKTEGVYKIAIKRMDRAVTLYDNETKTEFDFSNGDYSFESKAGTFENRFTLKIATGDVTGLAEIKKETGIVVMGNEDGIYINNVGGAQVDIYSMSGVQLGHNVSDGLVRLPKATYIVKVNNLSTKVLVK